jgi:biotin transport system substrate-specific component
MSGGCLVPCLWSLPGYSAGKVEVHGTVCHRLLRPLGPKTTAPAIDESENMIMVVSSTKSRQFETLADSMLARYFTADHTLSVMSQIVLVLAGSALLALSAQFAFRIPISPVQVTGQTLVVLMIGMAYGSRLGAATVLAYLVEGGMGLPVFANATAGWPVIMGPTGGYLIGFVAAAFILGRFAERGMGRGPVSTALAMVIGTAIIYAAGVSWLGQFIGFGKAVAAGMLPFLYGDALKLIVAAGLMPLAWRAVGALRQVADLDKDAE